jgi:hypothetical protein
MKLPMVMSHKFYSLIGTIGRKVKVVSAPGSTVGYLIIPEIPIQGVKVTSGVATEYGCISGQHGKSVSESLAHRGGKRLQRARQFVSDFHPPGDNGGA